MKDLRWHQEITALARREGWTVYEPPTERMRLEDPSFVAVKGLTVIAVWLRSAAVRADRMPPVDRFAGSGMRGFCWSPLDMAKARAVLLTADQPGVPDDAA
ncbi:hypothetical protein ABZ341_36200 [Streptomyces sp. NPDC006173]|uniref:hypothetical protein n=1 Tax=Streptomyces sp. NPDC006173 TaxID=3155349 RepID=UPI0033FC3728